MVNIYKTNFDVCKETQKEHTDTLDGLINGGCYIRDNIFVSKWIGLYPGGEALKWDFYGSMSQGYCCLRSILC